MADLSDLLGDVYGPARAPAPPAAEPAPAAAPTPPAWAEDDRLDAVFGSWVPGPPAEAPRAERELLAPSSPPRHAIPTPPPLDDDLASALSAALATPTALAATLAGEEVPPAPTVAINVPARSAQVHDGERWDGELDDERFDDERFDLESLEIAERLDAAALVAPVEQLAPAPADPAPAAEVPAPPVVAPVAPVASTSRFFASATAPADEPDVATPPAAAWQRADDDILPTASTAKRAKRRGRR